MKYLIIALLMSACGGKNGDSYLKDSNNAVGPCQVSPLNVQSQAATLENTTAAFWYADSNCNFSMNDPNGSGCFLYGTYADFTNVPGAAVIIVTQTSCPGSVIGSNRYNYTFNSGVLQITYRH